MFAVAESHRMQARFDVATQATPQKTQASRERSNYINRRWKRERTLIRKAHELATDFDQAVTLLIEPKGSRSHTKVYTNHPNRNRVFSVRDMMDYDYPMPQLFTPLSFKLMQRGPASHQASNDEGDESQWSEDDGNSGDSFLPESPSELQTPGLHNSPMIRDVGKPGFHIAPDYNRTLGSGTLQTPPGYDHPPSYVPPRDNPSPHGGGGKGLYIDPSKRKPRFFGVPVAPRSLPVTPRRPSTTRSSEASYLESSFWPIPVTPESHSTTRSSDASHLEPTPSLQEAVLSGRVQKATSRGRGRPRGRGGFGGGYRGQ